VPPFALVCGPPPPPPPSTTRIYLGSVRTHTYKPPARPRDNTHTTCLQAWEKVKLETTPQCSNGLSSPSQIPPRWQLGQSQEGFPWRPLGIVDANPTACCPWHRRTHSAKEDQRDSVRPSNPNPKSNEARCVPLTLTLSSPRLGVSSPNPPALPSYLPPRHSSFFFFLLRFALPLYTTSGFEHGTSRPSESWCMCSSASSLYFFERVFAFVEVMVLKDVLERMPNPRSSFILIL
jgi:hypothetical protein